MTHTEKAVSLVDYFMPIVKDLETAKKCAVKVCEEIINSDPTEPTAPDDAIDLYHYINAAKLFWNHVIEQIKAIR